MEEYRLPEMVFFVLQLPMMNNKLNMTVDDVPYPKNEDDESTRGIYPEFRYVMGWFIKEKSDGYYIATSHDGDNINPKFSHIYFIPKGAIILQFSELNFKYKFRDALSNMKRKFKDRKRIGIDEINEIIDKLLKDKDLNEID